MARKTLSQRRFYGGISESEREGIANSFFFGRGLDYRSEPDLLKILPETAKESASVVTDLIKEFENVGTDIYGVGDAGEFYRRTSAGSWSNVGTLTSASGNGIGYFPYDDFIYLPKNSVIARYGPIGGTPALTQDYFSDGTIDLDQFLDTSGSTYALTTSINEGATHRQSFAPQKDPQKSIQVNISAVGTSADWTLTVHDAANTSIATKTIANASLGTGDQTFTFATPWRPIIGAEYHFHLTATNTTGTPAVISATSADLEDGDFHSFYQILVTDTNYHPVAQMLENICFGNEQYIATYNGFGKEFGATVYNPHRLVLYKGWKARAFVPIAEYLAIIAWRGTAVTDQDHGMIYFWNGFSDSPDFVIDVDDGTVLAAAVVEKTLLYVTSAGNVYAWNGETQKLRTLPKMTAGKFIDVFPGAFVVWRGLPMLSVASDSDSTVIEKGAYSFGRLNEKYPVSLNYDYPISTGTRTGTGLDIGALGKNGTDLLIAWKDASTYGVDVVDAAGADPFGTTILETLTFDNERPDKQKLGLAIKVNHRPLATGQSVKIEYAIDDGSYDANSDAVTNSTASSKRTVLHMNKKTSRFYEIKVRITYSATTAGVETTSASLFYDDLEEELQFDTEL